MVSKHVVITGPGRMGSSFLVQFLTHLGVDTGFSPWEVRDKKDPIADGGAGLEHDLRRPGCPYVVKHPAFRNYICEIMHRPDVEVEHVIVMVRDLRAVIGSYDKLWLRTPWWIRLKVSLKPSGFWSKYAGDKRPDSELRREMYLLLEALAQYGVPVTLLHHPTILEDPEYLYNRLHPIFGGEIQDYWTAYHRALERKDDE